MDWDALLRKEVTVPADAYLYTSPSSGLKAPR